MTREQRGARYSTVDAKEYVKSVQSHTVFLHDFPHSMPRDPILTALSSVPAFRRLALSVPTEKSKLVCMFVCVYAGYCCLAETPN